MRSSERDGHQGPEVGPRVGGRTPDASPPLPLWERGSGGEGQPPHPRSRRPRRVSRTRRLFLNAIYYQITGARILSIIALVVLLGGGFAWLFLTTGSPVVGLTFLALAATIGIAIYWFIRVMRMFTRTR
ncbi:MAG: hypothetical protein HY332_08275 [Chloroflexi bacterium]|nr:hypothetical protein [Chloroflexota bacterium]